jgi:GINS complex subunit 2
MTSTIISSAVEPTARLLSIASFSVGDEPIRIVPLFSIKAPLPTIVAEAGGLTLGPFHAGAPTVVPLWVACFLRRKNLCRLEIPIWLSVENLSLVLEEERSPERGNSLSNRLPRCYMEMARKILGACGAYGNTQDCEVDSSQQLMMLLQDIESVRCDKLRRNIHTLSKQDLATPKEAPLIDARHIGNAERITLTPFLQSCFRMHRNISGLPSYIPDGTRKNTTASLSSPNRAATFPSKSIEEQNYDDGIADGP